MSHGPSVAARGRTPCKAFQVSVLLPRITQPSAERQLHHLPAHCFPGRRALGLLNTASQVRTNTPQRNHRGPGSLIWQQGFLPSALRPFWDSLFFVVGAVLLIAGH